MTGSIKTKWSFFQFDGERQSMRANDLDYKELLELLQRAVGVQWELRPYIKGLQPPKTRATRKREADQGQDPRQTSRARIATSG
jgi:hypothetical protein